MLDRTKLTPHVFFSPFLALPYLVFMTLASQAQAELPALKPCSCYGPTSTMRESLLIFVNVNAGSEFLDTFQSEDTCRRQRVENPQCRGSLPDVVSPPDNKIITWGNPASGRQLGLVPGVLLGKRDSLNYCNSLGHGWQPVSKADWWMDDFSDESISKYFAMLYYPFAESSFAKYFPEVVIDGVVVRGFWAKELTPLVPHPERTYFGQYAAKRQNGDLMWNYLQQKFLDEDVALPVVCSRG